ncbi:MAG TPA: antibiotic biosynthesis monooxygenase [Syntrophobacteraceae bacterium]|nr:antibiotic biosynthesis monooxygenase [Syntrophobacteraceae bacterium]
MAIRVIIERQTIPGNELQLNSLLMSLRSKAMHAKGYISGETLRSLESPNTFIVISTWNSLDDWKAWEQDAERKKIQSQIDALLRAPSKHQVYAYY